MSDLISIFNTGLLKHSEVFSSSNIIHVPLLSNSYLFFAKDVEFLHEKEINETICGIIGCIPIMLLLASLISSE